MMHMDTRTRGSMHIRTPLRVIDPKHWAEEEDAGFFSDTFGANYHDTSNGIMSQTWLSDANGTWDRMGANNSCSPENVRTRLPPSFQGQEDILYLPFPVEAENTQATPTVHDPADKTNINSTGGVIYHPPAQQDLNATEYGLAYHSETPQTSQAFGYQTLDDQKHSNHEGLYQHPSGYLHCHYPILECQPETQASRWPSTSSQEIHQATIFVNSFPDMTLPSAPPTGLKFDWSTSNYDVLPSSKDPSPMEVPVAKRKLQSLSTAPKTPINPPKALSDFVVVFENAPGALSSVKKRKKLDAPVRKAVKDVRRAGACHQCRFRKRTCSTVTPCGSCLKHGNGLQEIRCQRESPFVGKQMHQYFEHSSTRRVVSFDVSIPVGDSSVTGSEILVIDGVNRLSHPLRLRAGRRALKSFSNDTQKTIKRTEESKKGGRSQSTDTIRVTILEEDDTLGTQIEQWALEYTSKFVHAAGPEFYATTMAQILGIAYIKKGLPESNLVASMLRVASLAFILRAGVKVSTTNTQIHLRFRTVQARVDTILYERLKIAVKDLFQRLQAIIFRTAGVLNRDQVYPVALVMWQLMRILSIAASHLSNIADRFQPKASGPAEYQLHGLKLLVSTHMALFRSSNPLLLDFRDNFNQDLLERDKELIRLAMRMRKVVMDFRAKGFPDLKGSIGWKKEYFDMFRRVYDGL